MLETEIYFYIRNVCYALFYIFAVPRIYAALAVINCL